MENKEQQQNDYHHSGAVSLRDSYISDTMGMIKDYCSQILSTITMIDRLKVAQFLEENEGHRGRLKIIMTFPRFRGQLVKRQCQSLELDRAT